MATKIITKTGSGAPTTSEVDRGELAVDLTNTQLYTSDGTEVIKLGSGSGEGQWSLAPNGDDIYYNDGSVGVGADDPSSSAVGPTTLVVSGNANAGINIASPANNSFLYMGKAGSTDVDGRIAYYNNSKVMSFATDGTDRLTIDATGNVGIGMTPVTFDLSAKEQLAEWKTKAKKASWPVVTDGAFEQEPTEELVEQWVETRAAGDKLQVAGNISATGKVIADTPSDFGKPDDVWGAQGYYGVGELGGLYTGGNGVVSLVANGYRNKSDEWTSLNANGKTGAAEIRLSPEGDIVFHQDADKADGSSRVPTTRASFMSDGKVTFSGTVGIGTNDPAEKLTVSGPVLSNKASYGSNQNQAYMIAAAKGYDGSTTNWGTHGYQHRLKTSASGSSRITIDTMQGEVWSMGGNGVTTFAETVRIGMNPATTTFDLTADEQLAEWKTKAKEASWPIVTDGAFEQEPTEELVEEFLTRVAHSGKLQVEGGASINGDLLASKPDAGANALAVGSGAGETAQGYRTVAIGYWAGKANQLQNSVAVGTQAGSENQGQSATAVGNQAGSIGQSENGVAVGREAAKEGQGIASIAIGARSGITNQGANGIIISSSGGTTNNTTAGHIVLKSSKGSLVYNGSNAWTFAGGDVSGGGLFFNSIVQDGAPVVDSLQIIRAFMKLRDAVDDPDSSVEELREKLKVAVVDIIDQFQDQIDNMDIPE